MNRILLRSPHGRTNGLHRWHWLLTILPLTLVSLMMPAAEALATRWLGAAPEGDVDQVQQWLLRFSDPMIALGDARAAAPARLSCQGSVPRHSGRWQNERSYSFDFETALPPGTRCTVTLVDELRDAAGKPVDGRAGPQPVQREARIATGGPRITRSRPYEGSEVEEEQHFVLTLNGPVDFETVESNAYCIVQGLAERVPLKLLRRDPLLKPDGSMPRGMSAVPAGQSLTVACQRPLPADRTVTLVWGKGISAAGAVARKTDQRLQFRTRAPFAASFSCERTQPTEPCIPLSSMRVEFNAPIARATAERLVLRQMTLGATGATGSVAGGGPASRDLKPRWSRDQDAELVSTVEFAPTYLERQEFQILVPSELRDASGRSLSNLSLFPLTVRTGELPPLAKFASSPFGILELNDSPALPITVRNVESELNVRAMTAASARSVREREVIDWLKRLNRLHEREIQTGIDATRQPIMTQTRTLSLIRMLEQARGRDGAADRQLLEQSRVSKIALPRADAARRPFEVIGLPLPDPGFYMVEVESLMLGQALLERNAPMYVRTGTLVTNLAVHAKLGRDNGLVWVTTLDRGQVVPDAQVRAFDCAGKSLWEGRTDAQGVARIDAALPRQQNCEDWDGGLLISARKALPAGRGASPASEDFSFVLTHWNQGIESWRFNVPSADESPASLRAHTVFDRTLLRAGETVSMKHFVRQETLHGLAPVPAPRLATTQRIVHVGSDQEFTQTLQWQGQRFASAQFRIPKDAKLGLYQVFLERKAEDGSTSGPTSLLSGSFRVEEFRLPVLTGRIVPPKEAQIAVRELPLEVQVGFLSGGPAAQMPVQVSALLRRRAASFPDYEEFNFEVSGSTLESEGNEAAGQSTSQSESALQAQLGGPGQLIVDRRPLTLDGQGSVRTVIDAIRPSSVARELVVEASYNDPNGETQTLSQVVPIHPSEVVVGVKAERWISVTDSLKLKAVALTTAGAPKADVPIEVRAVQVKRSSSRKRLVGGLYSYENRVERVDLGVMCTGKSNARGEFDCAATFKQTGEIVLMASATDAAGRRAQSDASIWVTAEGETWFEAENHDRIDLLPEKKRYEPGQVARFQVRMPFRQASALVSVEREGVIETRVVNLSGRDPSIEVPIKASYGPNVYVSVLALRGRLREVPWYSLFTWGWQSPKTWWQARQNARDHQAPTAMVDLSKPAYKLGVAEIRVGLAAQELNVAVSTDKPRYEIRQNARARFKVTGADGQPAPSGTQLAVAVVDQALLELAENGSWRVLEALMQRRGYGIEHSTAQMQVIGKRHFGRKAVAPGGAGGRAPTRELFDTLLLWRAELEVDAQGEAQLDIPINDSLTTFRVVAIADSTDQRFGTGSASFRTTQDLQIMAGLPPMVRDADRFQAMATVRNGSERVMQVAFSARSPELAVPFETNFELAPGAARELAWPVAPGDAQATSGRAAVDRRLNWELSARDTTSSAADRVRVEQRVAPAVPEVVTQSTLVQLSAARALPTRQPDDSLALRGGVRVTVQNRLADGLPGVRRYFETYPFVCLEQKTSKSIGLRDAALWQTVVDEMASYLDADGLADYFPVGGPQGERASGSETLTAYLLSVTHEAARLDSRFAIPEALRGRMERALIGVVEGRIRRDHWAPQRDLVPRRLAALEALSRSGKVTSSLLETLAVDGNALPTHSLIDWYSIVLRQTDLPQRAEKLAAAEQVLRGRLSYQGNRLTWASEERDHWWWLMVNGDVNAARLLSLAAESQAWKDDAPRLALGLLGRFKAGHWMTTNANLLGSLAIDRFSQAYERDPVAGTTAAVLRDARGLETARAVDWTAAGRGGSVELAWPEDRRQAQIGLAHDGTGKPWVTVQTLAAVEAKAAQSAGFRLERLLEPVQVRQPGAFSRGDVWRVKLKVTPSAAANWVVVNDPVPAGATILGSGLGRDSQIGNQPSADAASARGGSGAWRAYEERAFEGYRAYYRFVSQRPFDIEYTVRLNNPGAFRLPPTRVEAMYNPEMFGQLTATTITVLP